MKKPNKKWKKQKAEELTTSFKGKTFSNFEEAEQFLFRKVQGVIDDTVDKIEELYKREQKKNLSQDKISRNEGPFKG